VIFHYAQQSHRAFRDFRYQILQPRVAPVETPHGSGHPDQATARKLTLEERRESARRVAKARWARTAKLVAEITKRSKTLENRIAAKPRTAARLAKKR